MTILSLQVDEPPILAVRPLSGACQPAAASAACRFTRRAGLLVEAKRLVKAMMMVNPRERIDIRQACGS